MFRMTSIVLRIAARRLHRHGNSCGGNELTLTEDEPPPANDAKCGFACRTIVKNRDYVFTDYGRR